MKHIQELQVRLGQQELQAQLVRKVRKVRQDLPEQPLLFQAQLVRKVRKVQKVQLRLLLERPDLLARPELQDLRVSKVSKVLLLPSRAQLALKV